MYYNIAINQMRDKCTGKTKQTLFVDQLVAKIVTIVATLCSFKIMELFSFMKAKKSLRDFIKFLLFWSTLKTFEIKQGLPMTEEKKITMCTKSRASDE